MTSLLSPPLGVNLPCGSCGAPKLDGRWEHRGSLDAPWILRGSMTPQIILDESGVRLVPDGAPSAIVPGRFVRRFRSSDGLNFDIHYDREPTTDDLSAARGLVSKLLRSDP